MHRYNKPCMQTTSNRVSTSLWFTVHKPVMAALPLQMSLLVRMMNIPVMLHHWKLIDVGTTYLGKNGTDRMAPFVLETSFLCDPYAWTTGTLLDGSRVLVQIDTRVTKCIMSKGFYDAYLILHDPTKYKPYTMTLEIGNSSHVPMNFIIPLVISFKEHNFKLYTLINGSTNNKLLLLGMKNAVEIHLCQNFSDEISEQISFFVANTKLHYPHWTEMFCKT